MLKRIIAGTTLGGVAFALACSSNIPSDEEDSRAVVESSTVTLKSFDATGAQMSSCSGTLLGPNLVLTAGHCTAGATRFAVTAKGGQASAGKHAVSTGWKDFRSTLSRRGHTDAALVELDSAIALSRYPSVVNNDVDGATLHRIERGSDGSVVSVDVPVVSGTSKGFAHDYLGTYGGTSRDTGGAVYDDRGAIHGVVSGIGADSKMLHVAKVEGYSTWVNVAQKQCDPGGSSSSSSGVVIRSLGLLGWGSASGGTNPGSSGWGGGNGGYGGKGKTIDAGNSSGDTTSSASSSGSASSSSSGNTSTSSSSGSTSTSSGGPPGDSCLPPPGDDGDTVGSSSSGGSSGLPSSSSSGSTTSSSGTSTSSGGSSGNPPITTGGPGKPSGPGGEDDMDECGGCELAPNCVDNVIDYGDSKSGGNSVGGAGPVIK